MATRLPFAMLRLVGIAATDHARPEKPSSAAQLVFDDPADGPFGLRAGIEAWRSSDSRSVDSEDFAMYEEFFGLERRPFAATPDPTCFIPLEGPQSALDALAVCCERGQGVGVLTGSAGTGKTLIGMRLAFEIQPTLATVFLPHSSFPTRRSLLQAILFELQRPYSRMAEQELRLELTAALKSLRSEKDALALILDEAHQLSESLLDELRLLALLSDHGEPLARIVLIGNPELEERLAAPALAALNQRICCQVEIDPLTRAESISYLQDSLKWAGVSAEEIFDTEALEFIARAADGIPRCLNQLADHTLLLAYVGEHRTVSVELAQHALEDLKQLPLMWHDPIRGGEIFRGRPANPSVEDSAVDLWPTREVAAERSESVEAEPRLAPLDGTGASVEIGADLEVPDYECSISEVHATCEFAAESPLVAQEMECGSDSESTCDLACSGDAEISDNSPVSELSCLRQDWAAVPPPEPHSAKWTDGSKLSSTEEAVDSDAEVTGFEQPTFGQTFGARDAEYGTPSADSFQVEEFAARSWEPDEQQSASCDRARESAVFATAGHRDADSNPFDSGFGFDGEIEFEEEPVIDRYVRKHSGPDTPGMIWEIGSSSKHHPVGPMPPPLPQPSVDFSEILAKPLTQHQNLEEDDSQDELEPSGIVQDLSVEAESIHLSDDVQWDEEDVQEVQVHQFSTVNWEADEESTDPSRLVCQPDDPVVPSQGERDRDLSTTLFDVEDSDNDIEHQIGVEVLDLCHDTHRVAVEHQPSQASWTQKVEMPAANELSELEAAISDGDEWSDEPSPTFDLVQPETVATDDLDCEATVELRHPGIVQRAYRRLFSELRAKQH